MAIIVAAAFQIAGVAHGQISTGGAGSLYRSDVAGTRVEPSLEPKPVVIGDSLLTLDAAMGATIDNNVFNDATRRRSDVSGYIEPSARLRTAWSRHSLVVGGDLRVTRFAKFARENSETFQLFTDSRFDLSPTAWLASSFRIAREVEARGTGGINIRNAEPSSATLLSARVTGDARVGRLHLQPSLFSESRTYDDLRSTTPSRQIIRQQFRNSRNLGVALRVDAELLPSATLFTRVSASATSSPDDVPARIRNARGVTALIGARAEFGPTAVAEVAVGYRNRDYRLPLYRDFGGVTWDATVDWYPSALVSARFQAGQDFVNSGLIDEPGVLAEQLRFRAYWDAKRDTRVAVFVDYERDRFRQLDLTTDEIAITLRAERKMSAHFKVGVQMRSRRKQSSNANLVDGFNGASAAVSITGML